MWPIKVAGRHVAQTPIISQGHEVLRSLNKALITVVPAALTLSEYCHAGDPSSEYCNDAPIKMPPSCKQTHHQ